MRFRHGTKYRRCPRGISDLPLGLRIPFWQGLNFGSCDRRQLIANSLTKCSWCRICVETFVGAPYFGRSLWFDQWNPLTSARTVLDFGSACGPSNSRELITLFVLSKSVVPPSYRTTESRISLPTKKLSSSLSLGSFARVQRTQRNLRPGEASIACPWKRESTIKLKRSGLGGSGKDGCSNLSILPSCKTHICLCPPTSAGCCLDDSSTRKSANASNSPSASEAPWSVRMDSAYFRTAGLAE